MVIIKKAISIQIALCLLLSAISINSMCFGNEVKIAYSNQMNVINNVQNRRRLVIAKSIEDELTYHIDTIIGEDDD